MSLPDHLSDLTRLIHEQRADFVVLDSLRRLAPTMREDLSDDMSVVLGGLTRVAHQTGAALLIVHHKSNKANAATYRGSSAIQDQVDMLFTLDPESVPGRQGSKAGLGEVSDRRRPADPTSGTDGRRRGRPLRGERVAQQEPLRVQLRGTVLGALKGEGPLNVADVCRAITRDPKDRTVRDVLKDLAGDGPRRARRGSSLGTGVTRRVGGVSGVAPRVGTPPHPAFLTAGQVAQETGLHPDTVRRAITAGELKAAKPRGRWIIRRDWFEEWIERHTVAVASSVPPPGHGCRSKRALDAIGSADRLQAIERGEL